MSISVESNMTLNASSTFNKRPRFQPKVKLTINTANFEERKIVISKNSSSSYYVQNYPVHPDLTPASSSSKYMCKKIFFGENVHTKVYQDFSSLGSHHYVTQKSNGKEMQDTYKVKTSTKIPGLSFFAVYDGHSTQTIAEMLADKLDEYILDSFETHQDLDSAIKEAFLRAENEVLQHLQELKPRGGSTALCGIFYKDLLYVANLGDSRAVMFQNNDIVNLSKLHDFSNPDELQYVESKGGIVLNKRLEGELAVSRSIGDIRYRAYMNKEPEIAMHQLGKEDEYLFLATDGFWNGINPVATFEMVKTLKEKSGEQEIDLKFLGDSLVEEACRNIKTKKDNMTLIIVNIKELLKN